MTDRTSAARASPSGYGPPPLDVSVRSEDPYAWLIEVRGELDLYTSPLLKQHLESYNDPSGNFGPPQKVVYLLPELEFMDTSGFQALLTAVEGHGPETITIREPSSFVSQLLELVGFASMIEGRTNP